MTQFSRSFNTGYVPKSIEIAKIIPIYKTEEKFLFHNFRPISLLPALSKIIEKLVHKKLYEILNKNQFGFRPNYSTIDAVLKLMQELYKVKDNKLHNISIFLDLSKEKDFYNRPPNFNN